MMLPVLTASWLSIAVPIQHDHSGVVGQFYSGWYQPGGWYRDGKRKISCCSYNDCAPVRIIWRDGGWYAVGHKLFAGEVPLPDKVLEHNQSDPRESPDGGSHVCLHPGSCAVLGSGQ